LGKKLTEWRRERSEGFGGERKAGDFAEPGVWGKGVKGRRTDLVVEGRGEKEWADNFLKEKVFRRIV
jgi:hypothetical protein